MNIKKFLLATIFSFVVMFLLSFLWYGVLMMHFYQNTPGAIGDMDIINRDQPMILFLVLGYVILAALMAYAYPKGVESEKKIMEGLKFGVWVGLLWILPGSFIQYAVTEVLSLKVVAVDTLWHIVEQGAGGIVIAIMYGAKKD